MLAKTETSVPRELSRELEPHIAAIRDLVHILTRLGESGDVIDSETDRLAVCRLTGEIHKHIDAIGDAVGVQTTVE